MFVQQFEHVAKRHNLFTTMVALRPITNVDIEKVILVIRGLANALAPCRHLDTKAHLLSIYFWVTKVLTKE